MWLEFALRTRVFKRPRRLLLTVLPVTLPFLVWDAYAISQGHWWFDTDRILGVYLPGEIPLDDLLFFIVIPIASILTLEAVRSVRGWPAGDEIA
jgi:lycopene cyclase domain-containing protein